MSDLWGSIPDWVQAIGNVAVLVTAFEAIRRERRRIKAVEQEQEDQRRQHRLDRASGASAWPEDWSPHDVRVVCRNGCPEPIYDVTVRVAEDAAAEPPDSVDRQNARSLFVMRPGEELDATIPLARALSTQPMVDMVFRDTRGDRWWRRPDGRLVLVRSSVTTAAD